MPKKLWMEKCRGPDHNDDVGTTELCRVLRGSIGVRIDFRKISLATLWSVDQKGRLRLGTQGKERKGPGWAG